MRTFMSVLLQWTLARKGFTFQNLTKKSSAQYSPVKLFFRKLGKVNKGAKKQVLV